MLRHSSPISGVACYKETYIATAGYDNRVILWDSKKTTPIAVGYHDHLANHCEFSPCGKYLITSSSDHTARLWALPNMKLKAVLSDHNDDVECSSFHPTKELIATASRDHSIRIYDYEGRLLQKLIGHEADVISVQWQGSSQHLVSSSDDGTIRLWDIQSGKMIENLSDSGVQTDALAISNTGIIYAGDDEGQVHVITRKNKFLIPAHNAGIKKIILNYDNSKLLTSSYDRKACIWNIDKCGKIEKCAEFYMPHFIWARSCSFLSEKEVVFATFGSSYAIYNYYTNEWHTQHIGDTHGINSVHVVRNAIWTVGDAGVIKKDNIVIRKIPSLCNFIKDCGAIILTSGQTGQVFNAETGEVIYTHHSPLNCAASYVSDGLNHVVIGSYTGDAIILKETLNHEIKLERIVKIHDNAIKGLAIDNNLLFSVCATGSAGWYDLSNNLKLFTLDDAHNKIANGCVALGERSFASISRDLQLRIWGINYSCEVLNTPHTHSIKCISVDATKRYIATGSYNGLIAFYDRSRDVWTTFRKTHFGISSITYDSEKNIFIASSYDGELYYFSRDLYESN